MTTKCEPKYYMVLTFGGSKAGQLHYDCCHETTTFYVATTTMHSELLAVLGLEKVLVFLCRFEWCLVSDVFLSLVMHVLCSFPALCSRTVQAFAVSSYSPLFGRHYRVVIRLPGDSIPGIYIEYFLRPAPCLL
jgi:hypothetical protein